MKLKIRNYTMQLTLNVCLHILRFNRSFNEHTNFLDNPQIYQQMFFFIRCKTSRYVKSLNQPLRILPSVNKPAPPKLQTTSLFWLYGCAETTLHCPLYIRHLTLLNLQIELSLWKLRNHYIGIF